MSIENIGLLLTAESFWYPERAVVQTAWHEHAPFAFWLVGAHRPKCVVELGTYAGFSYSCFCQCPFEKSLNHTNLM